MGGVIALFFLARLHLVFVYEVNWDEFLNLSMVHDYLRGDLKEPLQTLFIHAFRWVVALSINEVDQAIAARLVIYVMGVGTVIFLYLICRRFTSPSAALFAVLSYISFSYVIRQGMSFRTDPMAAFLMMGALWAVIGRTGRYAYAAFAGAFIGMAGMITIKSVFYLPTIGVILLTQFFFAADRKPAFITALISGLVAATTFIALYVLHRAALTDPASALSFLGRTTGKTLGERDFTAAKHAFTLAFLFNPIFCFAATLGLLEALKNAGKTAGQMRANWVVAASLSLILISLFVYTETYVYYYPFLIAPVAVLCGVGFASLSGHTGHKIAWAAVVILGFAFVGQYWQALQRTNDFQREIVAVAHRAFPEPVPYIDRSSMISSYPKKSIFMSKWGMTDYYRVGEPIMRDILVKDQPAFLIANRHMLDLDQLEEDEYGPTHFGFFKEDRDILRSNFIQHWGPIYVAGKQFELTVVKPQADFDIILAGTYSLEGPGPIILDGRPVNAERTIYLERGPHQIESAGSSGSYAFRWGKALFRPDKPAPDLPVFTDF